MRLIATLFAVSLAASGARAATETEHLFRGAAILMQYSEYCGPLTDEAMKTTGELVAAAGARDKRLLRAMVEIADMREKIGTENFCTLFRKDHPGFVK